MTRQQIIRSFWVGTMAAAVSIATLGYIFDSPAMLLRAIGYVVFCFFIHPSAWEKS